MMNQRTEVYKDTDDDWYPSYYLHHDYQGAMKGTPAQMLVRVSFLSLMDGQFRVCAWGEDDMGLERDFDTETEAWVVFLQVIGLDKVNQKTLRNVFEFVSA